MLLLALLIARGRQVVYVPGRTVNRMSGAYQGESKTDARVIADQARMRPRDFQYLDTPPEPVTTHRILTDYRADLIAPRVRLINRLRDLLVGICPAPEWAFGTDPDDSVGAARSQALSAAGWCRRDSQRPPAGAVAVGAFTPCRRRLWEWPGPTVAALLAFGKRDVQQGKEAFRTQMRSRTIR